jgi:shikimate kinase
MGPPGSGKTYVGHLLQERLGLTFIEGEAELLREYGSTENFIRHKAEALRRYFDRLRSIQVRSGGVVAFESTGLSDRAQLLALVAEAGCALVRVEASRESSVSRVAGREPGRNFTNEGAAEFFDYWHREVAPTYEFDAVIRNETESDDDIVEQVRSLLSAWR